MPALAKSVRAERAELTLNELLADHIIQMAISSTPLTLGEFKEHMRDLINQRVSIASGPELTHGVSGLHMAPESRPRSRIDTERIAN